jgi:hypothetical protein
VRGIRCPQGGLIDDCVVVYLDDVTIFSKYKMDHITHPIKIFNRSRRYAISLNPKKFVFVFNEGKLFLFIASKDGMMIKPEITEAIPKSTPTPPPPNNKDENYKWGHKQKESSMTIK